ncbi:hypothetical protein [Lutibacter sp.]|uniref:hypothetical protein n=1 Tax=Lutibacter sp. TaxID=1925666 RepID=UPI001A24EE82|nr:hypothetical protein [Lutibacter sp.]MBI9040597.1 hypothetical protein [Lutibacter sp.]
MKSFCSYLLFFFFSLIIYSQSDQGFYQDEWTYLPSDTEINNALNATYGLTQGCVAGTAKIDTDLELSKILKYHNKKLAGQYEPSRISFVKIYVYYPYIVGNKIQRYHLVQDHETGKFAFRYSFCADCPTTLLETYDEEYNFIKNSDDFAFGFAPPMGSSSSTSTNSGTDIDGIVSTEGEESEIPWELVIGGSIAAAVAAIIRKILKKTATSKTTKPNKNKKEKKEDEEDANYILQLNKNSFQLKLNEPENLDIQIWKVTSKGEKRCSAIIQIQNFEKALKITPTTGVNSLQAQLLLEKQPKETSFTILVNANAEGHEFQKEVSIQPFGELQIVIETLPDNKRTLRPDTYQTIACYAQVVDENGKCIADLTEKIQFVPKSDWLDLSTSIIENSKKGLNIGCTNPNPNASIPNPPKSVIVKIIMDDVAEGVEPLQTELEIALIDCKLEVEITECSFPVIDDLSEVTFDAYIENPDGEKDWNFNGEYRKGIDLDEPLTEISISRKSETEVSITLTGPILKPGDDETFLNKTLVIFAAQGEEKPLERHISVTVSQVGLFVKHGVEGKNELMFTADKPFESNLDFALYKFDKNTNQIIVDKDGLDNKLTFELQNEDQESINFVSVLQPTFKYDTLVSNIPYGRYIFKTQEDIPGFGDIRTLNYLVKAPFGMDDNPEVFEQVLKVRVRTFGIGKEFPEWVEAYEQCKTIINKYVPAGESRNKLNDILEKRKYTLGAEGLTKLRNNIWEIAQNLILAEGAEGYKNMEVWANRITVTLEWTEWAGDLAFNALMAYYLKGAGATVTGLSKGIIIEALNFYIYENDKGWDAFADRQYEKIIPLLMNVAKGRIISIENIELVVKKNKVLAWTIFISCEFLYNLYQTKSVVEAAKLTAAQMRDELIMRKITAQLQKNALKYNVKFTSPDEVLDDLVKSVKTVNGEEIIDPKKLLEFMRDPAAVRTIKKHGTEWMKQVFEKSRDKIYQKHDADLKKYISETYKIDPNDIKIDDFRTPGTGGKTNLNTDRDYRVLRKVKTESGDVWIEVQSPNWKQKSYEIFGETTGKPFGVDALEWAERHQQRGTDRFDAEACKDYADNTYNPSTGEVNRNKPNILQVKEGKGRLIDSEELGNMYKNKVNNALDPGMEPEAYAQAQKGVKTLKEVRDGYGVQGLDVPEIPDRLKKAMDIVEKAHIDASATPEHLKMLNEQLKDLKYENVGDVAKDMAESFKDLKKHDSNDPRQVIFGW